MSEPLELQIRGLEQIERALNELPVKLAQNVLRGALRAAAKPIAAAAFAQAPVLTGELASSVRVSSRIRNGIPWASVKAGGKNGVFWARWVEEGTAPHEIVPKDAKTLHIGGINARLVNHPGAIARRFLTRAAEEKAEEATQALIAYARKRLAKEGINVPDPEPEDPEE